ncbi:hypothetical protein LRS06_06585 [Hymenobacter sp. J193]|uniref:hypothetical protein n=1 Tax=Hymenobacter sp. J193 TaxID=2898429 RepID=UPI002150BA7C|nr:hypothetical protein [Hymenobacter sp. J193]MCR5887453.1 hypothetical protein [Hymenobacter sp. J193]
MKYLVLVFGLLASSWAVAQETPFQFSPLPLDARTHQVLYTGTVPKAATAAQLLERAQSWPGSAPYQATLRRCNPETGTMKMRVDSRHGLENYTGQLTIRVEDGAYTYHLTDLTYTQPGFARAGKHSPGTITQRLESLVYTRPSKYRTRKLTEIHARLQQLLESLHQAMHAEGPDLVTR